MTTNNIDMMNELNSKTYESTRKLADLTLRNLETLLSRQMDAATLFVETGLRQYRLVTENKNYNELMRAEMEMAREFGDRIVAESRQNMKLMGEAREGYRSWYEQNMAAAKKAPYFQAA